MLIIPAIDLRNGNCVRLVEGKLSNETIYSDDPAEMGRKWEAKGAQFIHLVDLDGAFAGEPKNTEAIKKILSAITIPAELGGGIRDMATIEMYLEMGINRVILGSIAVANPKLVEEACAKYGDRIVVGIDAKDGYVAVEGWDQTATRKALDLALEMKKLGVQRIIFTDIKRDGTLKGPNLESTRDMAEATGLKVTASGGVASLEDIAAVAKLEPYGVDSVITGKALYDGRIKLEEALKVVKNN